MNRKNLLIAAATIALATGVAVWNARNVRQRLLTENRRLEQLEAELRTARERRDENAGAQNAAAEKLDSLQGDAELPDAQAALVKDLWARIQRLQQRLDEMPAERIPELKMLGMKDWIDAVLTVETATDAQIRKVLRSLRYRARNRFAEKLHDALSRYIEASGGELPSDIRDLLPHLPPPADDAMLDRYAMRRSGKTAARDEELIGLKSPDEDGAISITAGGYGFKAHPTDTTKETSPGDLTAAWDNLSLAMEDSFPVDEWEAAMTPLAPIMEAALAPLDDAFGERLKAAVKNFTAANQGKPPRDLSQLRAVFPESDRVADMLHPVIAHFEYALDHGGKQPADPSQMRRYLERPVDVARVLRALKLSVEDDTVTMSFALK
ncbi:MAG TPA: hypothetical protein VHO24_06305 [Opitutaceae bacterium]|nr:hypothetical protein [Opitutaceae bacterium]